ncbi:zinc finger protein 28-like isoform X2 [Cotesia glomerata]|uniref:zinc finger protein 28-like isoform X2 n=1 Tax=Cotesia glomerata TaxID=32391 RepID=UPI001D010D31|nr:zinc finger protein 28-like isoform X2 [Cotesia glomerata]
MEPKSSIPYQQCDETELFASVKKIVYTNVIETNNINNKYLIFNNELNQQNIPDSISTTMLDDTNIYCGEQENSEINLQDLCRVCANTNNHMVPIFGDESLQHDLINKISRYLPINITKNDTLPLQLCYNCASTLIAWHDLLEGCLDAEQKLLGIEERLFTKKQVDKSDNLETVQQSVSHVESNPVPQSLEHEKEPIPENSKTPSEERCPSGRRRLQIKKKRVTPQKRTTEQKALILSSKIIIDGINYYKCSDCNKVLSTVYNFLTHRNTHSEDTPYVCETCGKGFKAASALTRHKATHGSRKKYPCDLCDRVLSSKSAIEEHLRTHSSDRPFTCQFCDKSFKQKSALYSHKKFHLTDATSKHKCSTCERVFPRSQELKKHILVHTHEKPYCCDICGKKFRTSGCVSRHKRIHTTEKIHKCNICGAQFGQKRYLKNHCRCKHKTTTELVD